MKDELKKNFEELLKNGGYAEAEKQLKEFMQENPEDMDAKLLYGTCRMMQGDAETAKQIHDEVEKQIAESGKLPEEQKSFWVKYERLIIYGAIGTALVIGGGYMVSIVSETIIREEMRGNPVASKYDGPRRAYELDMEVRENPWASGNKYDGPRWAYERQKEARAMLDEENGPREKDF